MEFFWMDNKGKFPKNVSNSTFLFVPFWSSKNRRMKNVLASICRYIRSKESLLFDTVFIKYIQMQWVMTGSFLKYGIVCVRNFEIDLFTFPPEEFEC